MRERPFLSHAWRTAIGGWVVSSDAWHAPTEPPRVADNADWFAFVRLMLPPNWGMGNGVGVWQNWEVLQPPLPVVQAGPYVNFGGLVSGDMRTTALLLAQADAVQRGLAQGVTPIG